jgi:predicted Rossmann fold nucleotide-binding protein DprA/Smf involved in DNA uptake
VNEYLSDVCERLSESATPKDLEKPNEGRVSLPEAGKPIAPTKSAKSSKSAKSKSKPELEFKTKTPPPQPAPQVDYSQLPEEQAAIAAALQKKSLTFDELLKKKLITADTAHEVLLDMELDGLIEKIAGDRYSIL